jgi:Protein of unknown function (DUF3306)
MSESFLSRWSRRKREAFTSPRLRGEVDARSASGEGVFPPADAVERAPHPDPLPASGEREQKPPTPDPSPPFAARTGGGEPHEPSSAQETEFDPATLPPIESIDAGTDVSAFLRPGVPAELTQAALRRAWATDPAIRDFVGLAENAWDFNKPGGVPGFEPLRAIDDVQRLIAHVAGVLPTAAPENPTAEEAAPTPISAQPEPAPLTQDESEPSEPTDAAPQKDVGHTTPPRPRHGGALAE